MRRYNRPEDEWVGVPFPPLVDDEIWEQAQEAKKRRLTRSGRNTKIFYLLQHLVRCAECGLLMGCRANRRQTTTRGGKVYRIALDPPRRYYMCYGMMTQGQKCREHSHIRAERLEAVVWSEVKKVMENPDLIVASIEALDAEAEDGGLADEIAKAERDLQKVQMEEDRAIRLYVSEKITERAAGPPAQVHHREAGNSADGALDDHRAQGNRRRWRSGRWRSTSSSGRGGPGTSWTVCQTRDSGRCLTSFWTGRQSDRNNRVNLTLAIPTEDVVSIAGRSPITACVHEWSGRRRGRSWRIGQTRPVKVVFMSYRNTLQADALKLVAKKLQSSLAVEGELPEDGLAAYGDDGDDLMMALARKIVSGDEDEAETVEEVFAQTRDAEATAEELLVDDRWKAVEINGNGGNGHHDAIGPTVELVPGNGHHANGNGHAPVPVNSPPRTGYGGNGHRDDEAPEPQRSLFSWAEFMAEEPVKPKGRKAQAPPLSLFEWAVEQEREEEAVGLSA